MRPPVALSGRLGTAPDRDGMSEAAASQMRREGSQGERGLRKTLPPSAIALRDAVDLYTDCAWLFTSGNGYEGGRSGRAVREQRLLRKISVLLEDLGDGSFNVGDFDVARQAIERGHRQKLEFLGWGWFSHCRFMNHWHYLSGRADHVP